MPSEKDLLNPSEMDGPTIRWTVTDLFKGNNIALMTYHVMSAGYAAFTPVGAAVGGMLHYAVKYRPYGTLLPMMGSASLVAGCSGAAVGYFGMASIAGKGESATPIPWNEEGVEQRVNGLNHNFKARILDLSAWNGVGAAAVALVAAGGPVKLGLRPGFLGVLQAVSLGSAVGSMAAFGCIFATSVKEKQDD